MKYLEIEISLNPFSEELKEVLIASLTMIGFDSFNENETGFVAYVNADDFNEKNFEKTIKGFISGKQKIKYKTSFLEEKNWNAEWEKNFDPVYIGNDCLIKAAFHKKLKKRKYTILIEPKMAFGTGHHATTFLMMEEILNTDVSKKKILDMGCGTGLLAILCSMKGAENVLAIDNDEWAYNNTKENIALNKINNIGIALGDAKLLTKKKFDIILANINRNILLADIKHYSKCIKKGGTLLLSGFYTSDLEDIKKECDSNAFEYTHHNIKDNWVAAGFSKK